jgi:hypothetical protein
MFESIISIFTVSGCTIYYLGSIKILSVDHQTIGFLIMLFNIAFQMFERMCILAAFFGIFPKLLKVTLYSLLALTYLASVVSVLSFFRSEISLISSMNMTASLHIHISGNHIS